jgi:hypothetical protein
VNTVMNLQVPSNERNLFISRAPEEGPLDGIAKFVGCECLSL